MAINTRIPMSDVVNTGRFFRQVQEVPGMMYRPYNIVIGKDYPIYYVYDRFLIVDEAGLVTRGMFVDGYNPITGYPDINNPELNERTFPIRHPGCFEII